MKRTGTLLAMILTTLSLMSCEIGGESGDGGAMRILALLGLSPSGSSPAMVSYSINGVTGTISGTSILVTLPCDTDHADLSDLVAQFDSTGAFVEVDGAPQDSGVTHNDINTPVTYTVTGDDDATKDYVVTVEIADGSQKELAAISIGGSSGVIFGTDVSVAVPCGTDRSTLVAVFTFNGVDVTVGGLSQESGVTVNDFSSPVEYVVHACDGGSETYTVTVSVAGNGEKEISAFSIDGHDGVISGNDIALALPGGTDISDLVATFAFTGNYVTVGVEIQESGVTSNDFSSAVEFTVHACDGTTVTYTVTVTAADLVAVGGRYSSMTPAGLYRFTVTETDGTPVDSMDSGTGQWSFSLTPGTYYLKLYGTMPPMHNNMYSGDASDLTYCSAENLFFTRQYVLVANADGTSQVQGATIAESYDMYGSMMMGAVPDLQPPATDNPAYRLGSMTAQGSAIETVLGAGNDAMYIAFSYDTVNRVTTKREYMGTAASDPLFRTTVTTLQSDGQILTQTADVEGGDENDSNSVYTYTGSRMDGSVTRMGSATPGMGTISMQATMTYDGDGRLVSISLEQTWPMPFSITYTYSYNTDNTISGIATSGGAETFLYTDGYITSLEIDQTAGHDLRLEYTLNTDHMPSQAAQYNGNFPEPPDFALHGTVTYAYNSFGLPVAMTYAGTDPDFAKALTYDAHGRQLSFSYDYSDGTSFDWFADMSYDGVTGNTVTHRFYKNTTSASGTPFLTVDYNWEAQ